MNPRVYENKKGLLSWNLRKRVYYSTYKGRLINVSAKKVYYFMHNDSLIYVSIKKVYYSTYKDRLIYVSAKRVYYFTHMGKWMYVFRKRVYCFIHKDRLFYDFMKRVYYSMFSWKWFTEDALKNILDQIFVQYSSNSSSYSYIWCQFISLTRKNPSQAVLSLFHSFFIFCNSAVDIIHRTLQDSFVIEWRICTIPS